MLDDYLQKIKNVLSVPYLKAVIYARYSSDMQRGESIDAQIRIMKDFAKKHNIIITAQYVDEAQSAKRDDREEFQRMIHESKNSDWQVVIVHKLDRFARNRYDSVNYRVLLRKNKKYLLSATEQLDDSPESVMLEAMIEAMAEYYSKNLSREVMKGLIENALKGKHCGGTPPLGYDIDPYKSYVINEFESRAIKLIFKRFLEGKSYNEIIAELNNAGYRTKKSRLFAKNSLHEILRNEKYTGAYVYNKMQSRDEFSGARSRHKYKPDDEIIKVEGVLPQIVSQEDFNRVQEAMSGRKRARTNNAKEQYLLTSKLICGECGGHFVGTRKFNSIGVKYISYVCSHKYNANYKCDNGGIRRDWLESNVLRTIKQQIQKFNCEYFEQIRMSYIDSISLNTEKEKQILRKEIEHTEKEIKRIVDVISSVNVESLMEKLQELEQKKSELNRQLQELNYVMDLGVSINEMKNLIKKAEKMLEKKEVPLKELIDLLVKKIVINKEDIQIYLNCFDEELLKENVDRPCIYKN